MAFLIEAGRLASVTRATRVVDDTRHENSAEHSWHVALYALVLAPHADPAVRIDRVIRMLLIHDIVEVDAGDVPLFSEHRGGAEQQDAERAAAARLFGLLPEAQRAELGALWAEFEAAETADARFAKALDRFQPPTLNLAVGGGSWDDYAVDEARLRARLTAPIESVALSL
jgi:putative hydrolase of HD superfamily